MNTELEYKASIYDYIRELDRCRIATPMNCQWELQKKFGISEAAADKIVDMYIKEELSRKDNLLLG